MGQLANAISQAVDDGRYLISEHAAERITERGFLEWQVIAGMMSAIVLKERPADQPHPVVEFELQLPDGTAFKAVWSLLTRTRVAKLVTVHFFDEG